MTKNSPIKFEIIAQDSKSRARAGIIKTRRGNIETPYLIPVATRGEIKSLSSEDVEFLQAQCLLANTYHLHLNPGDEKIKQQGGLHNMMKFQKPIFTDSGGFQVFSLGLGKEQSIRKIGFFPGEKTQITKEKSNGKITESGVVFKSIYPPYKEHFIGPKESMKIQSNLNADIIFAFDECTSPASDEAYIKESMERSHRWELESLEHHNPSQALYGIIHGGWFKDLRLESEKFINSQPFDGIAIGGSLGKSKEDMYEIIDWVIPELDSRPRHMLGIGWIDDLFECVERGIDTFDCVEMTRIARHGSLYITPKAGGSIKNKFRIDIAKSKYKRDNNPIDSSCTCYTCQNYTRSDIRALYKKMCQEKTRESRLEYGRLATLHNICFTSDLARQIRQTIITGNGEFQKLKQEWLG